MRPIWIDALDAWLLAHPYIFAAIVGGLALGSAIVAWYLLVIPQQIHAAWPPPAAPDETQQRRRLHALVEITRVPRDAA